MRLRFAILLALASTAVGTTAAEAQPRRDYQDSRDYRADGRGDRGYHHDNRRDRRAYARRDRHDRWVVGRFYNGRGYWDGHRWYQNRYRHHNGWRYR